MPWGPDVLDFFVGSVFGTDHRDGAPETCYFALLYSADPEFTLGGEPSGSGYERVDIINDDSLWTITDDELVNDVEIRWPPSLDEWSGDPLNQWAIYDAATVGVCWAFGPIDAPIDVSVAGRIPLVAAGDLVVTQLPY